MKYFWEAKHYKKLNFRERSIGISNVEFNPTERSVVAKFYSGHNLTLDLPNNYESYKLEFEQSAITTDADIEYISTWTNAKSLEIFDNIDVAFDLLERIDELKTLTKLESLKLHLHRYSLLQKDFSPFFNTFPKLKFIQFTFDEATSVKIVKRFVRGLKIPKKFKPVESNVQFYKSIAYKRNVL